MRKQRRVFYLIMRVGAGIGLFIFAYRVVSEFRARPTITLLLLGVAECVTLFFYLAARRPKNFSAK